MGEGPPAPTRSRLPRVKLVASAQSGRHLALPLASCVTLHKIVKAQASVFSAMKWGIAVSVVGSRRLIQ